MLLGTADAEVEVEDFFDETKVLALEILMIDEVSLELLVIELLVREVLVTEKLALEVLEFKTAELLALDLEVLELEVLELEVLELEVLELEVLELEVRELEVLELETLVLETLVPEVLMVASELVWELLVLVVENVLVLDEVPLVGAILLELAIAVAFRLYNARQFEPPQSSDPSPLQAIEQPLVTTTEPAFKLLSQ